MDVVYRLQGVEFEWDDQKALANVEKHGQDFRSHIIDDSRAHAGRDELSARL